MEINQKWQQSALHDLEFTGLSYEEIGQKYGRSRATIIKLFRLFNVKRKVPVARLGPQKTADMKSLSPEHRALGSRLTVYRSNKLLTQVAEELGVSRHILKLMEQGSHDFTLTQLSRIANMLDAPIQDLVMPISTMNPLRLPRKDAR